MIRFVLHPAFASVSLTFAKVCTGFRDRWIYLELLKCCPGIFFSTDKALNLLLGNTCIPHHSNPLS